MTLPSFVWCIVVLWGLTPVIYLLGRIGQREEPPGSPIARWAALAAMLAAWVPLGMAIASFAGSPARFTLGAIALEFDGLALLLAVLAMTLGTLAVIYSIGYMAGSDDEEKFYAMLVAMIGAIVGLGCATDLFNMWVWFEAMAITSYLLVAFYHDRPGALEAGVKYLVQSAAGSMLILLGIALVLMQTGTLDLSEIHAAATTSPVLLSAGGLFLIGFGVKAALVPVHTWLPDAHSQAPTGVSALLSGVVIEAGLFALLRVLAALANVTPDWGVILMGFGALNMLLGNLMALRQKRIKRLLAFSSLVHVGYMLLGFGVAIHTGTLTGAQGAMFHVFNHGLMKSLAFMAAGCFLYILHAAHSDHSALVADDLYGAAGRYPFAALAFSLALLALGGIPPLAGFMSKWQIFAACFDSGNAWVGGLAVFGALNSVLSLGYYAPLINKMYRKAPSAVIENGPDSLPLSMLVPLGLMALAIVVIGLWPVLLDWLSMPSGLALMAALGG